MRANDSPAVQVHPDEDTITAFVEARLESVENSNVVSHLVQCGDCRRATAQLMRLESELGPDESIISDDSPSRLGSFISGLAAHLVPSVEEEVFAYQNPDNEADQPKSETSDPADDTDQTKI